MSALPSALEPHARPQPPRTTCALDWALAYRRLGWSVIPINQATKKPPKDFLWKPYQDAAADEATIRTWYARWPQAGVGIVTGAVSGLWVVDVDSAEGAERLAALDLPTVPTVKTSKGRHLYFTQPGALRNTAKKVGGLDTRGEGGYVNAPPTRHPSGVAYAWDISPWDVAPQLPPPALSALFAERRAGPTTRAATGDAAGDGEEDVYARMLENGAPAGQRHGDMVKLVGHYIARGLSQREIAILLRPWVDRCSPPFPYDELDAAIRDLAAADARKQAGQAGSDDTLAQPDGGAAPATISPAVRELIATQRAELADWKAQAKAWELLFLNRPVPDKAKRVLAYLHKRYGVAIGRTCLDTMPCDLYPDEEDVEAEGFSRSIFNEGVDILLGLGLLTRQKVKKKAHPPDPDVDMETNVDPSHRARGKDWFWVYGLDGPAVNAWWRELPTLTAIPPTPRQIKAKTSREERLQRAIAEEKPTPDVVRALKRDVDEERKEKEKATMEAVALTFERNNARDALQEAQRIIQENQRQPAATARIMCRAGCGSFIKATEWCCDECRERERDLAGDSRVDVNHKSPPPAHTVAVINRVDVNLEYPARAPAPDVGAVGAGVGAPLKPCAGGCGDLTLRGWTCGPCAARVAAWEQGLHIPDRTAMRQEGVHDR